MSIHVQPPSGAQSRPLAAFADLSAAPVPSERHAALRASLSAHIERCIAILDSMEPDPDAEPDLSAIGGTIMAQHFDQTHWSHGEDAEDNGDFEPWLAGAQNGSERSMDLEGDDADLEPDVDDEPWLGAWTDREDQSNWGLAGNDQDLEQDDGDSGIADHGGLYEQGFTPGRGLELLRHEAEATRVDAAKLLAIIARLAGVHA